MDLSIIIVNYNVKHFLEQCLCSVRKALEGLHAEVIVVDNYSQDNSVGYLSPLFPEVKFIAAPSNLGFAKGCNRGLEEATGKYILFLNPDTIVPEDCFIKTISFFESHPDAGAVGVKMVDGSGKFLKESKRAFPSPLTSLFKLFGLSRLFPRSRVFSRYHLGHLNDNETNEVEVLAGAFMMIRRSVLEQVGSFDESFFMYGEDVDLSYRIQEGHQSNGKPWKNYYFADSTIIHFKGESTRKGSMNYVRMFYNAMSIFVKKHYGGSKAGIFNFFIHLAIWFRAGLSALSSFIRRLGLPMIDAGLILVSFWTIKLIWTSYIRTETEYESRLLWIAFPAFTVFYLAAAYYAGLYDRWYKTSQLIRSTLIATIVLLAGYALLPEQYRFSRGIVLFGAVLAFILISLLRAILISTHVLSSSKEKEEHETTLIAGSAKEYNETMLLLKEAGLHQKVLGRLSVTEEDENALASLDKLRTIASSLPFREIIFCEGTLSFSEIIKQLYLLPPDIAARIHAAKSRSIVGSDSKDSSGESLSHENGYQLADPYNRRLKRLVDILFSLWGILLFPFHLFMVRNPGRFFQNCFSVLFARKTWVGYTIEEKTLPFLMPAVLGCNGIPAGDNNSIPAESLHRINYWYARNYEPSSDLKIIFKLYRNTSVKSDTGRQ